MQLAKALSVSLYGMAGRLIEVEADISSNLPAFVLVGLPDASVNEAASRVRASTTNSNLALPGRRITVNLSPASVPKQGSGFDLAIAMATLAAANQVDKVKVGETIFLGELALDGSIKPISGILAALIASREFDIQRVVVPLANLAEAKLVSGLNVSGYDHLTQVAHAFGNRVQPKPELSTHKPQLTAPKSTVCFSEVVGQPEAIEALTVAAAGGHHIFMQGPPGAGKSMLASRFATILPELTETEAIEVAAIRSVAKLEVDSLSVQPPFQAPHHTASQVSMVGGGGSQPRPGLISLAHRGVLFLDEAPEFQSSVLEAMRQPLESGEIVISRASGHARFPASFQLLLAANPCPCGFAIGAGKQCTCTASARLRYQNRISGPLADRIDLRLQLNAVNASLVRQTNAGATQTSQELQAKVSLARSAASERLQGTPWSKNAQVPGPFLRRELRLGKAVTAQLDSALDRNLISMRGYDRCLRVAWSVADLAGVSAPRTEELATAMYLRGSDL